MFAAVLQDIGTCFQFRFQVMSFSEPRVEFRRSNFLSTTIAFQELVCVPSTSAAGSDFQLRHRWSRAANLTSFCISDNTENNNEYSIEFANFTYVSATKFDETVNWNNV